MSKDIENNAEQLLAAKEAVDCEVLENDLKNKSEKDWANDVIIGNCASTFSIAGATIGIVNKSKFPIPKKATIGSSGFDLRVDFSLFDPESKHVYGAKIHKENGCVSKITLPPLSRVLLPTGQYYLLPAGTEGQVRPRSGLAIKHGITVLNSPGTIDSDYRGEVCVILINMSNEPFEINDGDRIAQLVISLAVDPMITEYGNVDELSATDRGDGGFGHSGLK